MGRSACAPPRPVPFLHLMGLSCCVLLCLSISSSGPGSRAGPVAVLMQSVFVGKRDHIRLQLRPRHLFQMSERGWET